MSYFTDSNQIKEILSNNRRITVVGLSEKPHRASNNVSQYMMHHGYEIVPVNPNVQEIFGLKSYNSLLDVPDEPGIVNVFRRSEMVMEIVEQAIQKKASVVWLQLGVHDDKAVEMALNAGIKVVENRCIKIEHAHLF